MDRITQHMVGVAIMIMSLLLPQSVSSKTVLTATVDSSQITMGYQTAIRFQIVDNRDTQSQLVVDKAAFPPEVEMVDWVYGDTTDIGNGQVEMTRALIIQSFDSGVYTIPPFVLVSGPDSVRSKALTIKVNPVDVSELKDINPIAPTAAFITKWYDWLPDFITDYWAWILFAFLVIVAGICAYLMLTKRVKVNLLPQKKRLPPDVIAENRLNALRDDQLWEKGQEKEYYTRLIDILRDYLEERFGINAMEMTSSQILKALHSNEATRLPNRYMKKIVEIADFVKFAKVRPVPDDNVRSWQNAMQFVEETRPAPEPTSETEDAGKTQSSERYSNQNGKEEK